jgi:hypothetical protein
VKEVDAVSPEPQGPEPDERGEPVHGIYLEVEFECNDPVPPHHDSADDHRAITAHRSTKVDRRQGPEELRETSRRFREVQDELRREAVWGMW